jgi:transposase
MAQKPITMTQAKQIQQLTADGISISEIARRTGMSRNTVKKYLRKVEHLNEAELAESQAQMSDKALAAIIYNNDAAPVRGERFEKLVKHFEVAKKEMHGTGVTKQLLWVEYMGENEDGYKYSQYCYLFKKYLKDTDPAFHWEYNPGEFTQVDFAGKKLSYMQKETGEMISCEVFVGILPYSGFVFCIAVPSQRIPDFARCINEMVKYIGGLTKTILCDNLRTAVTLSDRYEPVFTEMCYQLSEHYSTTFSATRPASPTDKAMVEKAVDIVYTHVYAPLRKEVSTSLEMLNRRIREQLDRLNLKPYKGSKESRRDLFMRWEQSVLKPLPDQPYQVKKSKQVTVQRNYAIQLPDNGHYYTVPYEHVGRKVHISYDEKTVEVYLGLDRIAFHVRSSTEGKFNRIQDHMPPHHKAMLEMAGWTIDELLNRAGWVGEYTRQCASRIIHSSIYPEQNYKACNAMILLQKKYSKQRLEAACKRAANVPRPTLRMIRNILESGLDKQPLLFDTDDQRLPGHNNIRGKHNYT